MVVDFKLISYIEPIETKEQYFLYAVKRNCSGYYITVSNFVYDCNAKIVYDAVTIKDYRNVRHEDVLSLNGIYLKIVEPEEIEPENFIRFAFSTLGCYDLKCQFSEMYHDNELGIAGLCFSGLYYDIPKYQSRINKLKSYDLDVIESYVGTLKKEQEHIRQSEINLNLPKTPKRKTRILFPKTDDKP